MIKDIKKIQRRQIHNNHYQVSSFYDFVYIIFSLKDIQNYLYFIEGKIDKLFEELGDPPNQKGRPSEKNVFNLAKAILWDAHLFSSFRATESILKIFHKEWKLSHIDIYRAYNNPYVLFILNMLVERKGDERTRKYYRKRTWFTSEIKHKRPLILSH